MKPSEIGDLALAAKTTDDTALVHMRPSWLRKLLEERTALMSAVRNAIFVLEKYEEEDPTATLAGIYLPSAREALRIAESSPAPSP